MTLRFRALPGVKRGERCGLMVTNFSVLGMRTVLPFMRITRKVPKPESTTFSPLESVRPISSKNTSTASVAARLGR